MAKSLAVKLQQIASNAQVQVQQLANEATEKSFQYNTQEANTARAWQKEMSDTSHQREVADLKKAGLNPVLAANQGAQSYTTSSASAQANDPSGSIGSLAAQQMSGIAQGYSADKSASATRYAAKVSAAATREAAAATASAARYAATMQYQNNRMHEAWQNEYLKKETAAKKDILLNTPVNNPWALADKYLTKAKVADAIVDSKWMKGITNFTKGILNDPQKLFKDNIKAARNDYSKMITSYGVKKLNSFLTSAGLKNSKSNRNLLINAFVFGQNPAFSVLLSRMPKKNRRFSSTFLVR